MILRMSGSLTVELSKPTNILQRYRRLSEQFVIGVNCLDSGEMQDRPEKH